MRSGIRAHVCRNAIRARRVPFQAIGLAITDAVTGIGVASVLANIWNAKSIVGTGCTAITIGCATVCVVGARYGILGEGD